MIIIPSIFTFLVETLNNGMILSPPHHSTQNGGSSSNAANVNLARRDNNGMQQITQPPSSPLDSPLPSPLSVNSSASLPSSAIGLQVMSMTSTSTDTLDPNWQSKKSTVRERNASMFNNELMSDVLFVVGADCKYSVF